MILGKTATLYNNERKGKTRAKMLSFATIQVRSRKHTRLTYAAASSRRRAVNSSMKRVNWSNKW